MGLDGGHLRDKYSRAWHQTGPVLPKEKKMKKCLLSIFDSYFILLLRSSVDCLMFLFFFSALLLFHLCNVLYYIIYLILFYLLYLPYSALLRSFSFSLSLSPLVLSFSTFKLLIKATAAIWYAMLCTQYGLCIVQCVVISSFYCFHFVSFRFCFFMSDASHSSSSSLLLVLLL